MPYVQRGADGRPTSLHLEDPGAAEFLPDDHPEVQAFVGGRAGGDRFSQLDAEFVRVIEDVVDLLIVKNLINISDLPDQAQAKLFARKNFRERLSRSSLRLFEQPTDFGDEV